ncbi:hypothetical protein HN873_021897 [Arachis hypogaea]
MRCRTSRKRSGLIPRFGGLVCKWNQKSRPGKELQLCQERIALIRQNPVIDSAAIESKPIESATAGTVSGVQIVVVGIFSAASSSSYWVMLPHSSLEHDSLIRTPIKGVRKPISDLSGSGSTMVANERLSDSSPGPVVELDPRPTRRSFLLGTVKQASKASAEARIHTGNFKGGKDPGLPEALRARMLALEDEVNMVMGQYLGAVEGRQEEIVARRPPPEVMNCLDPICLLIIAGCSPHKTLIAHMAEDFNPLLVASDLAGFSGNLCEGSSVYPSLLTFLWLFDGNPPEKKG